MCLVAGALSCSMLGIPSGQNWSPGSGKLLGFAETGTVRVDKNADWDSVEAETRRLLPLFLAEAGYRQSAPDINVPGQMPLYRVDAVLVEREFLENWKTRRSLSAEVIILKNETPVAVGKAVLSGNKSLSSSTVLHDLLKLALSNALKALPKT